MKLRIVLLSALLGLMSSAAFAANTPAPAAGTGMGPMHGGMCKENAQECKDLAGKFDQWCSANADKCTALKAHVEKHREWCEQNKDKCKEMMERMHKHRHGEKDEDKGGDSDDGDDTSSPPA